MGENNPGVWVRALAFVLRPAVRLIVHQELGNLRRVDDPPLPRLYPLMGDRRPSPCAAFNSAAEALTAAESEKLRAAVCPKDQLGDAIDADVRRFALAVAQYQKQRELHDGFPDK